MDPTPVQYSPRWGAPPPEPSRQTAWFVWLVAIVLFAAPSITLAHLVARWQPDNTDDQMFAYFGWRMLHGATPYVDVWDNKPPGIFWLNALGFLVGGDSVQGVWALVLLAVIGAHLALLWTATTVYGRDAAAITTIFASFFLSHTLCRGGTNRTETFLNLFELLAVAVYVTSWSRPVAWRWLVAGALCGCAALCKQVGLASWMAMLMHLGYLAAFRKLTWAQAARRAAWLAAGCGASLGVAAGVLWLQGALGEAWFAVVTFNRAYFEIGATGWTHFYTRLDQLRRDFLPIFLLPTLMASAGLLHALLWRLRPGLRPAEIEAWTQRPGGFEGPVFLFSIWFAIGLYGALVSPHRLLHHFLPVIPPLMLLSGYFLNVILAEMTLLRRIQQRAWVAAAMVIMTYYSMESLWWQFAEVSGLWTERAPHRTDDGWRYELGVWEVVGREVERLTNPEDRVQAWGFLPGVYLEARRANACRFATTEKVDQVGQHASFVDDELESVLREKPPPVLIFPTSEYFRYMRLNTGGSVEPASAFGEWLAAHYWKRVDVAKFNIWIFQRNDVAPPGALETVQDYTAVWSWGAGSGGADARGR